MLSDIFTQSSVDLGLITFALWVMILEPVDNVSIKAGTNLLTKWHKTADYIHSTTNSF